MTGSWTHRDALDAVTDFVRNELYGPIVERPVRGALEAVPPDSDPEGLDKDAPRGAYPGECIRYRPTKRYVVGLLHPKPEVKSEKKDEADEELDDADSDSKVARAAQKDAELAEKDTEKDSGEAAAGADDIENVNQFRPQAMAVSFKARQGSSLTLVVQGARYERAMIRERNLWRRIPIVVSHSFNPGGQATESPHRENMTVSVDDSISLEIVLRIAPDREQGLVWVTASVVNVTGKGNRDTATLFQSELTVKLSDDWKLVGGDKADPYRNRAVPVRGHGCTARVVEKDGELSVVGEHFPVADTPAASADIEGLTLPLRDFSSWDSSGRALADELRSRYQSWIAAAAARFSEYPEDQETLDRGRAFLARMEEGIALIDTDQDVRWCFEKTNEAMRLQSRRAKEETRTRGEDGSYPSLPAETKDPDYAWRPFQLAFLLANIAPSSDPEHTDREVVDVIWMPTGGGKTEAYLALAAFTILLERLRAVKDGHATSGVTVVMRYTLRLLTSQQLQRAASTICALEIIRRGSEDKLGRSKITIGAWLGHQASPNSRKQALTDLNRMNGARSRSRKEREAEMSFILRRCPWCAADLIGDNPESSGYRREKTREGMERVHLSCPDSACELSDAIPAYDVDDDIYEVRPEFLVGTIDKFARLATLPSPDNLFLWRRRGASAKKEPHTAPALVIQDELHLIDGPLGSVAGLYETAISAVSEEASRRAARIVGATATTAGTDDQIRQLYGRTHRIVPPPGPTIEDSFFSREIGESVGKRWLCVYAPGERALDLRSRVTQVLAQAAQHVKLATSTPDLYDPWWTNVCFFQSRRDVGLAASRANASNNIRSIIKAETGIPSLRNRLRLSELTAVAVKDVAATLASLEVSAPGKNAADLVLATSMIEVGLDSARLGLMTIVGQPKTSGQYIQVAGRVGRVAEKPGLVITVFNPQRPRDLSAFETFHQTHDRLYERVEHATVTPWAAAAQRRALAGALAILLRAETKDQPRTLTSLLGVDESMRRRVRQTDPSEFDTLNEELGRLERALAASQAPDWFNRDDQVGLSFLALSDYYDSGVNSLPDRWEVQESMRSVDKESEIQVRRGAEGVAPLEENKIAEDERGAAEAAPVTAEGYEEEEGDPF